VASAEDYVRAVWPGIGMPTADIPIKNPNAQVLQYCKIDGSVLAATTDGLVERRGELSMPSPPQRCLRPDLHDVRQSSNLWLYTECGLISILGRPYNSGVDTPT